MALFLEQNGHDVHIVTTPPYYPYWQIGPGYHGWQYCKEAWQGVEIYRCPLWVPKQLSGVKRLLHLFSFALSSIPVLCGQIFWHADVVMSIAPSLMNAPLALSTAKLSGSKTWLHIQDFELDAASQLGILPTNGGLKNTAVRIERRLLQRFDRVSTISNRMLERLHQKGVSPVKTVLFPNWVDPEVIFPLADPQKKLREKWGIPAERIVVLYSGNMGKKQGLEVVIDAARLLRAEPNIHFVLCGDGVTRQSLENAARDLTNIQFLPVQPLEKLNELLNCANIHVLPQRADAADLVMPSKLSGMLASGKAVIALANAGTEVAEVLRNIAVVIPPEEGTALAENILELAKNPEERIRLGQAGLTWVKENWSKNKVLTNFCTALESEVKQQNE